MSRGGKKFKKAVQARLAASAGGTAKAANAAAAAASAGAAEGAAEASPEALSYPPSARADGDALMLDAPAPAEVRGR